MTALQESLQVNILLNITTSSITSVARKGSMQMISHNRKLSLSLGMFCLVLIAIGVMVWPPPKDALAVDTTFRARVDWNGRTPRNNEIRLILTTRAAVDGLTIETRVMNLVRNVEDVSTYQVVFTPNRQARVWDVTLINVRQHLWIPKLMPIRDRQEILAGVISDLDANFICIDQ